MGSGRVNIEIIFTGRSNVGKSTLFSHLFGVRVRKGKRPGTTIAPNFYSYRDLLATDLPGFGYVKGVSRGFNERVKDFIVHYIEENASRIAAGVIVIDSKAFREVVERWDSRGYIPVDVEMADFLRDVGVEVIVCANKFDKVENGEEVLEYISSRMSVDRERVIPTVAKKGDISGVKNTLKDVLARRGRVDLFGAFK
ncbi:putative GTPase [Geoglobus ahangari]|uniref:Probable GTP-binding protein EngB n=1 Tax=Geoglobus ahangari TaxID=113653 RepID=A0A0F7IEX1_9EURY|nr:GTP-binding protein EngB [Geoglobus ahangari]AKG90962.1 putative GTPase [Geoglobus ahangari]